MTENLQILAYGPVGSGTVIETSLKQVFFEFDIVHMKRAFAQELVFHTGFRIHLPFRFTLSICKILTDIDAQATRQRIEVLLVDSHVIAHRKVVAFEVIVRKLYLRLNKPERFLLSESHLLAALSRNAEAPIVIRAFDWSSIQHICLDTLMIVIRAQNKIGITANTVLPSSIEVKTF